MDEQKQILEQYLKAKFSDKEALSIIRLDNLRDGQENNNYTLGY